VAGGYSFRLDRGRAQRETENARGRVERGVREKERVRGKVVKIRVFSNL
jgi:hypothetical protein